jgi:hypothetical protein
MPYSVNWFIENEIIYTTYSGVMTTDELKKSSVTIISLIESSPRSLVHIINDGGNVTQALSPKQGLSIIREVKPHPRAGWNISLHEISMFSKMLFMFSSSILGMRNRSFDTMEEAVAFLKEMDSTLSWDRADYSFISVNNS